MTWFRKKGKYWYFVEKIDNKEVQHYIGTDQVVKDKLLPNKKLTDQKEIIKSGKTLDDKKAAATRPGPDHQDLPAA